MGKYKVTQGQNLYDVSLHIYGSIEGILDLLVNNASLSLDKELCSGEELLYTDDYLINREVAAYYDTHGIVPASGQRQVYPKYFTLPKTLEIYIPGKEINAGFTLSGEGVLEADWGDNSPVEIIRVSDTRQSVSHIFDSPATGGKRKITLYMSASLKSLDISGLRLLALYILKPVYVERLIVCDTASGLESLPLFEGLFFLSLDRVRTENLMPLVELKGLMNLYLDGFVYRQPTIDAYLIALVKRHGGRRNCHIRMQTVPSGSYAEPDKDDHNRYILTSGMEAVWVLTHEPAWNEGGSWEFIINDTKYTYEQNN